MEAREMMNCPECIENYVPGQWTECTHEDFSVNYLDFDNQGSYEQEPCEDCGRTLCDGSCEECPICGEIECQCEYCPACGEYVDSCWCDDEEPEVNDDFPMYLEYDDWKDDFRSDYDSDLGEHAW